MLTLVIKDEYWYIFSYESFSSLTFRQLSRLLCSVKIFFSALDLTY